MIEGLYLDHLIFEGVKIDAKGETRSCFHLPKRDTIILITG